MEVKVEQLIPQNLLSLLHAPEVHAEIGLDETQVQELERLFEEIDGVWLRARNASVDEQLRMHQVLSQQVQAWLKSHTTVEQRRRLRELEYRSLGTRMLLRPEVADLLQLTTEQRSELLAAAKQSALATEQLRQASLSGEPTEQLEERLRDSLEGELDATRRLLTAEQLAQVRLLRGEAFDTAQLKRIYPMAPELVSSGHWINSEPLTLRQLRGKVVILHFYAFQCHNCHANFPHYKRWHQEFDSADVVVLGIQTPETSAERDPKQVREAAKERGIDYPVLIDLESKNWAAWANTMWPSVYVIDRRGYIRQWWQGELNWNGADGDQRLQKLVEEIIAEEA